ncbi:hypothetical protein [uncultured Megasphaera sp.]|uniref:hypothetical protein n=1 Tax=uncultured Megasphaera sp. TaxID=165188 RepID=UPI00130046DC|nr:hypothetical protein [uncultured Megasphaera sp.]
MEQKTNIKGTAYEESGGQDIFCKKNRIFSPQKYTFLKKFYFNVGNHVKLSQNRPYHAV